MATTRPASAPLRRLAFVAVTVTATIGALVASIGAAAPASPQSQLSPPAQVDSSLEPIPPKRETMAVIGDSYSSYYGDHRSRHPGWWALLGTDLGLDPVVDATAGTGFLARGATCDDTGYSARMATIREAAPRILLVEGGRNDWRRCGAQGRPVEATRTHIAAAADRYFAALGDVWDELGRPRADVYVFSPWGRSKARKGRVIRPLIRDAALHHGFTWVRTDPLNRRQAPDGIHPVDEGSRFLRDQILQNSDLASRFGPLAE